MSVISLQVEVRSDAKNAFVDWQADFNRQIASAPGFVSLEFSLLLEQQKNWLIVQRFINSDAIIGWRNNNEYKRLIGELKLLTSNKEVKEEACDASSRLRNITEVIVTEVKPGMEDNFRSWSAKIHQIEAKFPGFRGVYIQSPKGSGSHWITLLQFDTMENLDRWLQSSERRQVLQESSSMISSLESHRVISPYAGWFASIAKTGELPPVWKQSMLVLLVLFPIVILELKFLSPLTTSLNASVGTFISNALSVALISFPMMPIAIYFLGWWLSTDNLKMTIEGTLLIGLLYVIEIALFWNFL